MAQYSENKFVDRTTNAFIDRTTNTYSYMRVDLVVISQLVQIWGIYVGSELNQIYGLGSSVKSQLIQQYALKLASELKQLYGDVPTPISQLLQLYGDASQPKSALLQKWGDALRLKSSLTQKWHLYGEVRSVLKQLWTITQDEVKSQLVQKYNLEENQKVMSALHQYWGLIGGDTIEQTPDVGIIGSHTPVVIIDDGSTGSTGEGSSTGGGSGGTGGVPTGDVGPDIPTAGGNTISFTKIKIAASRQDFRISITLEVADEANFNKLKKGSQIQITIGNDTFYGIVFKKYRPRITNQLKTYLIVAYSKSMLLTTPYSASINQEYNPGLASEYATQFGAVKNISVDWQVTNWNISAGKLFATNESPKDMIQKLARVPKAMLQSDKIGDLEVKLKRAVPISQWSTASPTRTFSLSHFTSITENPVEKQGYNRVLISDQLTSSNRSFLEYEDISEFSKYVKAFIAPWSDSVNAYLKSTGDVQTEPTNRVEIIETITEEIEFKNGTASTQYPIYNYSGITWLKTNLGSVTVGEDGQAKASYTTGPTFGHSLASITYQTRYLRWIATDRNIERVQYILIIPEAE